MEVAPGGEAGLLEQRSDALARGAGVGRGLEHDELVGLQHLGESAGGVDQRPEVRLAVARERRRHADDHGVGLGQARVARGRVDPLVQLSEQLGGDVLDVGVAGLDRLDLARVDVDGDHVAALLGKGNGQRQADVAEPDDADGLHSGAV